MNKKIKLLSVALALSALACGCSGEQEPPAPSASDVPPVVSDTSTPEPSPETPSDNAPEAVDLDALASDILAALPEAYQGSKWLNASCEDEDGSVYVIMQVDQGSDDADAALSLAAECFVIVKDTVEGNGATLDSVAVTVVNDGAALGIYSTADGKDFTLIADGKRTEVSLP